MMLATAIIDSGKIFIQFVWDFLYFPFWWYSRGFWEILKWAGNFLLRQLNTTGLLIWVKNLFVPMFGQHDWSGIIISFFMRCVQIIARSVIMLFWLVYVITIIFIWLVLPIFVLYELVLQLNL